MIVFARMLNTDVRKTKAKKLNQLKDTTAEFKSRTRLIPTNCINAKTIVKFAGNRILDNRIENVIYVSGTKSPSRTDESNNREAQGGTTAPITNNRAEMLSCPAQINKYKKLK